LKVKNEIPTGSRMSSRAALTPSSAAIVSPKKLAYLKYARIPRFVARLSTSQRRLVAGSAAPSIRIAHA
jgi:hypothetical protein